MVTTVWHGVDVGVGVYAVSKQPSKLNWLRLALALTGLIGNLAMAKKERTRGYYIN